MTNTQKLIQAQRKMIKLLSARFGLTFSEFAKVTKLRKRIARLEKKILQEETIKE